MSHFIVTNENPKEAGGMGNTVEILKAHGINGFSDPRSIKEMDDHVQHKERAH